MKEKNINSLSASSAEFLKKFLVLNKLYYNIKIKNNSSYLLIETQVKREKRKERH